MVPIISAPTITMKPTPSATRAPAKMRGSAAGSTTWRNSATPDDVHRARGADSTGSTCFTAAMTLDSITQKQP